MKAKNIHVALRTLLFSLAIPVTAAQADAAPTAIRIVCASAIVENQEVILATPKGDGAWEEIAPTKIRSSQPGDAITLEAGEIHLIVKDEAAPRSLGHFTLPEGAPPSLVLMNASDDAKRYDIRVVDPQKLGFDMGTTLILNFSLQTAVVSIGETEKKLEAGSHVVAKPATEEDGTFWTMVSLVDVVGDTARVYDRQATADPKARSILFLLPDDTLGLKVITLALPGDIK